jgi:hypothetical protein
MGVYVVLLQCQYLELYKIECQIIVNLLAPVLHLIKINHQPKKTIFQFIILTFVYSSACFGRFLAHHQEHSTTVTTIRR